MPARLGAVQGGFYEDQHALMQQLSPTRQPLHDRILAQLQRRGDTRDRLLLAII
jgi:hypothetical protein